MDFILYHANCQDGWAAAYVAKKKWPQATLVPLSYGLAAGEIDAIFALTFQKDVFMVDYSFPTRELMQQLANTTKSLRVLDHHISKKEVLAGFDFAVFDNERSGAGLAWDYLFGGESQGPYGENVLDRPWWVDYTEDQDLWRWKLPYSREINGYLMVQERTVERWQQIETIKEPMAVFEQGIGIQQRTEFDVRDTLRNLQAGRFHGYRTGVVNASIVVSEVGEAIYNQGYDIALMWHERKQGDISFGLRSKTVDVGAIAKQYGGGGHKAASGFETSLERGREILDAILGRCEEIGVHGTTRCC